MRRAFIAAFMINVALAIGALAVLPERVAIHFGPGGTADDWAPAWVNTLIFLGVNVMIFGLIAVSPRLTFMLPPRWVNLPHKEYWLRPEHRAQTEAMLCGLMWEFGFALMLVLLAAGLLTIGANLSDPVRLHETAFLSAIGLFFLYTGYWLIRWFRAFRLPADAGTTNRAHG